MFWAPYYEYLDVATDSNFFNILNFDTNIMAINIRVPEDGITFYGDEIVSIADIVRNNEKSVRVGLESIFGGIGLSKELLSETIDYCIETAKNYSTLLEYEHSLHTFMIEKGVWEKYHAKKTNRASIRFEKVKEYLSGESVLDLGCGSGKIGAWASEAGYNVTLADVYENPNIVSLGLPFYKIKDGEPLPLGDESFDNVLNLGMLHHTQDPMHSILESRRVLKKGGKLHLIETIYGVPINSEGRVYGTDDSYFKSLSIEEQRQICMYFDYFGNHVLDAYTENPDHYVPVPFNFTTPGNIKKLFQENCYKLLSQENLGIYPFSFNYHVHFVFVK
jgi:ubiquinone/menaquinone biosynthesis C-methylase UbiE